MSRILLTSLGTNAYTPCTYRIASAVSEREAFFSVALAAVLKPDRVISLETKDALSSGNATRLAALLKETQSSLWRQADHGDKAGLPKKLISLGGQLETAASNLVLLRTGALRESSAALGKALEVGREEVFVHAPPFGNLLEPVWREISRFGGTELPTLCELVGWLADREQIAAALTLASEWITSYVMVRSGQANHHSDHANRKPFGAALAALEQNRMDPDSESATCMERIRMKLGAGELAEVCRLASAIRSARNDLNHAGFNQQPASAAALAAKSKEIARCLERLMASQSV